MSDSLHSVSTAAASAVSAVSAPAVSAPATPATTISTQAILAACTNGHPPLLEYLLTDLKADPNTANENGWSALMAACQKGRGGNVKMLLRYSANVHHGAPKLSALATACLHGHVSCVEALIEGGANVNAVLSGGKSAVMAASQKGHVGVLKSLLAIRCDFNQAADDGATPLLLACYEGHTPAVDLLLDAGVPINQGANNNRTALMLAARYGHANLVARLLVRGADVHLEQNGGGTALTFASQCANPLVVQLLVGRSADVNHAASDGWTPLMVACLFGHLAIIRALLRCGAECNHKAHTGNTPLMAAARCRNLASIEQLLRYTRGVINIGMADSQGQTALMLAEKECFTAREKANRDDFRHWTEVASILHAAAGMPPHQVSPSLSPGWIPTPTWRVRRRSTEEGVVAAEGWDRSCRARADSMLDIEEQASTEERDVAGRPRPEISDHPLERMPVYDAHGLPQPDVTPLLERKPVLDAHRFGQLNDAPDSSKGTAGADSELSEEALVSEMRYLQDETFLSGANDELDRDYDLFMAFLTEDCMT